MKTNYEGFRGWINYIRDYKDNKDNDLISANEMIKANSEISILNRKIDNITFLSKEKDNLIALKEKRIEVLNQKLSSYAKRNDELRKSLEKQCDVSNDLEAMLNKKELERRKNAGAIGGLKKKISELKLDLEKANHKINFLEKSKHAPSKEEIIAYETRMKEVEKKLKKNID